MELFVKDINLSLFYIELFIGYWITWILNKANPKVESFSPLAD